MKIPLRTDTLDEAVERFQRDGLVILTDVDDRPAEMLTGMLAELSGLSPGEIRTAGERGDIEITAEMRQKLARGHMTPELAAACHEALGDLLVRLVGPIIHTSKTFHYQMKRRSTSQVMLKGYSGEGKEVQALYGLHNEFTAARIITSPSAVVCWVPLNDYDAPAIHFYPGSHRLGLLANRWLSSQIEDVARIGPTLEYRPRRGDLVIFHFLTMHGSGAATDDPLPDVEGDPVRISCDLRFFPFCGVLDSEATSLRPDPVAWIREREAGLEDDLLLGPLFETLAYCGLAIDWPDLPEGSVAHWARFVEGVVRGNEAQRRDAIEGLVNTEVGFDALDSYLERFASPALCPRPYASIEELVPESREVLASRTR